LSIDNFITLTQGRDRPHPFAGAFTIFRRDLEHDPHHSSVAAVTEGLDVGREGERGSLSRYDRGRQKQQNWYELAESHAFTSDLTGASISSATNAARTTLSPNLGEQNHKKC
jgi:hypothetical protein